MILYTNNKTPEKEIKKTSPLTTVSKRRKYLVINLSKEVKDLYIENYKTLMKATEKDTNKWKDSPCSWIGRINIVKIFLLPKTSYRFKAIPIKISIIFFMEIQNYPKIYTEAQKTSKWSNNYGKVEQSWRHHTF